MTENHDEIPRNFRQQVYDEVRRIPAGRVLGYGHVAARLERPRMARQVGYALAALEPGSDVPWWRVIRSSGHLALQGDPSRGPLQRRLLQDEGVVFDGDDHVDMAVYGWVGG